MGTPDNRAADVLLSDGTTVHLRAIDPSDAPAIVDLHSRFSERTRYLRYFSPYPRIPERDLERFVNVDHRDREALVAALGDQLIGVGRYERLGPRSPDAEVAFVVEDAHQGRGIGSIMLEHLAAAAAEAGITRFVAEVLPTNSAMLRVFAEAGFEVQRRYADGVVHLNFPIAPTERSLEVQWGREHRTEARSLARLLTPSTVAVYGASSTGLGIGAAVLRNLEAAGFQGRLVPVHRSAERVGGLPAYRRAVDADGRVDLAVVAVPPEGVPAVVADAAAAGVYGLVVISAGFAESGAEGEAWQRELASAAHRSGMRVVGPNCLGIANTDPAVRLNATLAPRLPPHGRVGFFSQSGVLGVALLAEADRRGLGLSSFVSAGNRADVSGNDLLQYWQADAGTDVILLYLETFGNPRKFARLVRRIGRRKPVVAVASARRADGDGEPLLGEDAVGALFAQSGMIRVDTVAELFDVGVLLADKPLPAGRRVGIVTNSSALAQLAGTACRAHDLEVPGGYPAGVGPQADPAAFTEVLRGGLADPAVDALVLVFAPPLPGERNGEADFASAVSAACADADKPVVGTWVASVPPPDVAAYPSVEEAVRALARVVGYAEWLREPPGTVPEPDGVSPEPARTLLARLADAPVCATSVRVPGEDANAVGELLGYYGLPVVPAYGPVGGSARAVALAATRIGYPVAMKVERFLNRIDLGAVRLGLKSEAEVRRAYRELQHLFGTDVGVVLQPMVAPGVGCLVEAREDPWFGPVVGFGLAGVATELLGDLAWRAVPLTDRDARALLEAPRAAPLLHGYRGATPVDRGALADLLVRVGQLIDDHPRLRRLVLNPVLARPDGWSVLHASIELGGPAARPDTGPRRL